MRAPRPMLLAPGTLCLFGGETFRVVQRRNKSNILEFLREHDSQTFYFTDETLWQAFHSGNFVLPTDQPLLPVPLDQQGPNRVNPTLPATRSRSIEDARFYHPYLEAWRELELGSFVLNGELLPPSKSVSTRMRVAEAIAHKKGHAKVPGYSTLAWRYSDYKVTQDLRQIESRHHKKGNRSARFCPVVENIIQVSIKEYHLTPSPMNFTTLHKTISDRVHDHFVSEGWPSENARKRAPSIPTVTKRVREIPASVRTHSQFGYVKAHRDHHVFGTREEPTFPLQFVEADHTGHPTIAVDPIHSLVLGPANLTLMVDRFSTCIIGMNLYFDNPSFDMISIALKDTLLPKEDAADRYDVDLTNTWNQFGLPHRLCIDGGPDFAGQDLSEACYRLGISIVDLPRMSPWYKGTVESTIKTLKTHFRQTYPGTPAYNLVKKLQLPDPDKYANYAVMTLDDLKRALVKWIVDVYHQQPRPGSSKTRQQVWDEGIAFGTVPPPDPSFIQVATGRTKYGSLQHYGVQHNRLKYQSPELGKIRAFQEGGKPAKVKFIVYPEDCTRIDVEDPRTNEMIPAFAHRWRELEGMSHWQWNVLRRQFGKERDENIDQAELAETRRKIQAMVAEVMRRKGSTTRRKVAAFLDSAQPSRALPQPSPYPPDSSPPASSDPAHQSSTPPLADQEQDNGSAEADDDSDGWGGDYDNPRT